MTIVRAKALNGHGLNAFQPIGGVADIVPHQPSYFVSSIGYAVSFASSRKADFFESSVGFPIVVLNDTSPLGEIICAPDPIQTKSCVAV